MHRRYRHHAPGEERGQVLHEGRLPSVHSSPPAVSGMRCCCCFDVVDGGVIGFGVAVFVVVVVIVSWCFDIMVLFLLDTLIVVFNCRCSYFCCCHHHFYLRASVLL